MTLRDRLQVELTDEEYMRIGRRQLWIMGIPNLTNEVLIVCTLLITDANTNGETFIDFKTLISHLSLPATRVEAALMDACALNLLKPAGQSENGIPGWEINEGHIPDIDDDLLNMLRTALPLRLRTLAYQSTDESLSEFLLLEAMAYVGHIGHDDTIRVTASEIEQYRPQYNEKRISAILLELRETGLISELRRMSGTTSGIYKLHLPGLEHGFLPASGYSTHLPTVSSESADACGDSL